MNKTFLGIFIILFFSSVTSYTNPTNKFDLNIKKTEETEVENFLEVILFKKRIKFIESLAKKITRADVITSNSLEYFLLNKKTKKIKLEIKKCSFFKLECSLYFH